MRYYPADINLRYNPVDIYLRYYPADICPGSNLLCSSVAQVGQRHNFSEVLSLTYLDNHFHPLYQSANIGYFRHIAQKVLLIKTRYDICPTLVILIALVSLKSCEILLNVTEHEFPFICEITCFLRPYFIIQ